MTSIFKFGRTTVRQFALALFLPVVAVLLLACDQQRISELEEGFSTEADVRAKFGEPEAVWQDAAGNRVFEYNRQPAGAKNYMISIGADGKMAALRQVLNAQTFAKITPGMLLEEVRKMLGKPMKATFFELKGVWHYDWRYMDGPNEADKKIFTVVLDRELRVLSTTSVADPALERR